MRSMTGYASGMKTTPRFDVFVELKSVNSRYFELKVKSAFYLNELEIQMKSKIFEKIKRGKIDLFIRVVEKDAANYDIVVNHDLVNKYKDALNAIAKNTGIVLEISMRDFTAMDGVLTLERVKRDKELETVVMEQLDIMLGKMSKMMGREGRKTVDDIENSLAMMKENLEIVEKLYPKSIENYKKNLKEKINEFSNGKFDGNRILMEVDLVASRTAINEEIVRLKSHIDHMEKILEGKQKGDSKKLDFIGQEMNREANTIASKSSDYTILKSTIAIRGEIEKIREQLRNLA